MFLCCWVHFSVNIAVQVHTASTTETELPIKHNLANIHTMPQLPIIAELLVPIWGAHVQSTPELGILMCGIIPHTTTYHH